MTISHLDDCAVGRMLRDPRPVEHLDLMPETESVHLRGHLALVPPLVRSHRRVNYEGGVIQQTNAALGSVANNSQTIRIKIVIYIKTILIEANHYNNIFHV